jgi:Nucleotidyltransferase domain
MVGRIPDVVGVILGGSVGRGEPWPLSDIDLIVVAAIDLPSTLAGSSRIMPTGSPRCGERLTVTSDEVRNAVAGGPHGHARVQRFNELAMRFRSLVLHARPARIRPQRSPGVRRSLAYFGSSRRTTVSFDVTAT